MLYACELVCDRICKHGYVSKYHDWYTYIIYIMMPLDNLQTNVTLKGYDNYVSSLLPSINKVN